MIEYETFSIKVLEGLNQEKYKLKLFVQEYIFYKTRRIKHD